MKGKRTFLDRNKRKGLLAALLLFLRERKLLAALLLFVFTASTVILSPLPWISGKERFASAGPRTYIALLDEFRAAKADAVKINGLGYFFGFAGIPTGVSGPSSSIAYVKGSRADLEHRETSLPGNKTIAGVVAPEDSKGSRAAVPLARGDLGGEREVAAKNEFAGGFISGLIGGGPGSAGDQPPGGAYAGKNFFSGVGAGVYRDGDLARSALPATPFSAPSARTYHGTKGSLSRSASQAMIGRSMRGAAAALDVINNPKAAYAQLAVGSGRDILGTAPNCVAPGCPAEFADVNSGAIYDGNAIGEGFLTSSDPGANAAGLISSAVSVPADSQLSSGDDADNMVACQQAAQACAATQQTFASEFAPIQDRINQDYNSMPAACGNPCNCGPCNALQSDIQAQCANLQVTAQQAESTPCVLPSVCASLGITVEPPAAMDQTAAEPLCQTQIGSCGCGNIFCSIKCAL